ncbi:hypothetical protein [Actinomadura sp. 7K534]|uniref:TlpA family protein disulfide reductase n=1 Tax=Actinomadura sp. 7K534 TaxID=2530366 RepID=UPI00104F2F0A|nr:hypothetical protein [Actinomadura sp. 7K534]TDB95827.1 hypothetical protein E1266_11900 [Actinomadura sp. 7K534]
MSVLVVWTACIGILCLLNLLLTYGLIRKVRAMQSRHSAERPEVSFPVGAEVQEFSAVTTANDVLDRASFTSPTLIAFLSPDCEPCQAILPEFVAQASTRERPAVAVVLGSPDRAGQWAESLEEVCPVVIETPGAAMSAAFGIKGTPAVLTVENGRIVGTGLPVDARSGTGLTTE